MAGFSVRPSRNKCGYCKQECLHIKASAVTRIYPRSETQGKYGTKCLQQRVVLGGFVYSWTAEATTYLLINKQFPPSLTYEMCVELLLLTKNKTRTKSKGTIIKQTKQLEPPMGGRSLGLLLYSIRRGFLRQRPAYWASQQL